MAASRYDFQSLDGKAMDSFKFIDPKKLYSEDDMYIKLQYGQRVDNLAHLYLGDGRYWWVICLINGLSTPYDPSLVAGKVLRVPTSVSKVFKILEELNA